MVGLDNSRAHEVAVANLFRVEGVLRLLNFYYFFFASGSPAQKASRFRGRW